MYGEYNMFFIYKLQDGNIILRCVFAGLFPVKTAQKNIFKIWNK